MAGPESMRGSELERVERRFLLAAGLVGVKGRGELRVFFFFFFFFLFWCFTRGYEKGERAS